MQMAAESSYKRRDQVMIIISSRGLALQWFKLYYNKMQMAAESSYKHRDQVMNATAIVLVLIWYMKKNIV